MKQILTLICALCVLNTAALAQEQIGVPGPEGGTVCDNEYALCTSATCTPDPTAPSERAICKCVVENGLNYGIATSCAGRAPTPVSDTYTLISTYSFAEADTKKVMTCDGSDIWTDCLDMPCVADPRDPGKALCTCKIKTGGPFVTYGGKCDTGTCTKGYWSAATKPAFAIGSAAMITALKLKGQPRPYSFCEPE